MPDPLDTSDPAPAAAPPANVGRDITCSACGCKLARNGEIVSTGEIYKKFLKHDALIEKKDEEIARLQGELAQAKQEIDRLKSSGGVPASSGYRPGSRVR